MLTLELSVHDGTVAPREIPVEGPKLLLGRAPHCDVVLDGREYGASGEHVRIERQGNAYFLFDLGSTNGTALNGTRIRPHTSTPLANNDKIYVGRWLIRCRLTRPEARHWHRGADQDPRARVLLQRLTVAPQDPEGFQQALRQALSEFDAHDRSNLLRQAEELAQDDRLRGAIAQEIDRRESLRDACYEAMTALSLHHTGQDRFNSPDEVMRFFRLADQALELMLEWVVGCISSRRTFEERFSAKVTRFFGMEANPIKHALTPNQAGAYLLNWEAERDAEEIKKNLEEVLRDLTVHQLALLGGVQQALKKALEQLDPEVQERKASEGGGILGGPFARSKAWLAYRETYKDMVENESKLFNEVIYPSLRQGYLAAHEQQLNESREQEGGPSGPQSTAVIQPDGGAAGS